MNIPFGILIHPLFDARFPASARYSFFGSVIGHEVSQIAHLDHDAAILIDAFYSSAMHSVGWVLNELIQPFWV